MDFFNRDNRRENNFNRESSDRRNINGDFNSMNNFDDRYNRRSSRETSRGLFDSDKSTRRFDRKLPPISEPNSGGSNFSRRKSQLNTTDNIQQQVFPIGNVMLFSPKSYGDVQTLIDHLRRHEPAIVDFADVDSEGGQRILDFLSGAIYALGGSMQRVSGTIFLLTPAGVSITAPTDIGKSIEEKRKNK